VVSVPESAPQLTGLAEGVLLSGPAPAADGHLVLAQRLVEAAQAGVLAQGVVEDRRPRPAQPEDEEVQD
jgi:hypothetical protein